MLAVATLLVSMSAGAATFTVTSTADSGPGSLRQAILDANANAGFDSITFAIPGGGVHTIAPSSALPVITDPAAIDARSQPGYSAASPVIELSGASAPIGTNGLWVTAGDTTILGLVINRFQAIPLGGGGNGILLITGGSNTVSECFIGTDPTGNVAVGNSLTGIMLVSSSGNAIGALGGGFGAGNLISGNGVGISVALSSDGNQIVSNLIGTNWAGTAALGNVADGITLLGGVANRVTGNVISGNARNGLSVAGATGTLIGGNRVGTDLTGTTVVSNAFAGVTVQGGGVPGTRVGSPGMGIPGNLLSGNGTNGLLLMNSSTGTIVQGNFIGTDATGSAGLGNSGSGVAIVYASGNRIGGQNAGEGNVISGNGTDGVQLTTGAFNNTVTGNLIGTNSAGTAALGNGADGIQIRDGSWGNNIGVFFGDGLVTVVSGNGLNGVRITGAMSSGNIVQGLFIGLTADGIGSLPNEANGVLIENGASGNFIGGGIGWSRIENNVGAGVQISSGSGNLISTNVIRGNGTAGISVSVGETNRLTVNSISGNGGLGIDLAPVGVTPNDGDDSDPGPNQLQNFPILSSASAASGDTHVLGSLTSTPSMTFRVEFFANAACDGSGNGEGQSFLGFADVGTDAGGIAAIDAVVHQPASGAFITATATDPAGNTSEFSPCVVLPGPVLTSIAPTSGPASGGTTITLTGMQFQSSVTVTVGGVAATSPAGVDDSHATAVTPALGPGLLYDVTLTNLDGLSGTLTKGWLADFTDVPGSHPFHNFVEKLVRKSVTAGCGGGLFCVNDPVTRAQVAVLLLRSHDGPAFVPPPATGTYFTDVPINGFAAAWIEELSRRSVTAGCGGGNYCPTTPITRAQMSVFLLRMEHGPAYVPPNPTGIFPDVPTTSGFARWVEQLFHEGITGGCGGGNFCPDAPNTRGQMAVFLVTTFAL